MTKLTNEQIKDDLRDRLYCVVDPDGDEIITLEQAAEEVLSLRQEVERGRAFAAQVKKKLNKNGEYSPLSHMWVDCILSGKDISEE